MNCFAYSDDENVNCGELIGLKSERAAKLFLQLFQL